MTGPKEVAAPLTCKETTDEDLASAKKNAQRELLHKRRISCDGYLREDGLWDIEATLVDTRSFASPTMFNGMLPANEPLHRMKIRIAIDEDMVIKEAEASTDRAPGKDCIPIGLVYNDLVGMKIGSGFIRAVKERFRGRQGCTHLTELIGTVATTAFQTLRGHADRSKKVVHPEILKDGEKPNLIDSCHNFRNDGEVVLIRWPTFYAKSPK